MPENCVFWQRGGNDVDRRGNNNEKTIKSRLHRPWFKGEEGGIKKLWRGKKILQGVANNLYAFLIIKIHTWRSDCNFHMKFIICSRSFLCVGQCAPENPSSTVHRK